MNKLINKLSLLTILLSVLLYSCNTENKKKSVLDFTDHKHSEEIHLFDNDNYPAFSLDAHILLPTDSIEYKALYKAMAQTYFDSLYNSSASANDNLEHIASLFISNYRTNEEDLKLDSADIGSSYNWEVIKKNKIVFKGKNYLSFLNEAFAFTGGAHGNTLRSYYIFDLKNNKLLTSQELFKANSCEAIIKLQKEILKKEGREMDDLYADGYRCDANFYLSEKGIVFHYDQYEIACYADGPIDVVIPFEDIKPFFLKSDLLEDVK